MLEKTETEETIGFFVTFLSLVKLQLREACLPPLAYAYAPIEENKNGVRKFSARFLAFSNEISTVQKIVLFSSRGQGNFQGLEASRPRTSKCVLEDVLEAKDVLEDSTSDGRTQIEQEGTKDLSVTESSSHPEISHIKLLGVSVFHVDEYVA